MNKSIGIAVAVVAAVLFAVATAPVAGGSPAYLNINGCVIEPSANCERANLRGANLHGANLHGANQSGANLEGARMVEYTGCEPDEARFGFGLFGSD